MLRSLLALAVVCGFALLEVQAQPNKKGKGGPAKTITGADAAEQMAPAGKPVPTAELTALIDRQIAAKLSAANIPPSPVASDAEFLRRIYLDLAGVIPPADKATAFLTSTAADKRAKLIDDLLASDRYGFHQADLWTPLLFPRTSDNRRVSPYELTVWLNKQFNANTPWNVFASRLVTAHGDVDDAPAGLFYIANPTADKMTDTIAKAFMGLRVECAQCHNHPFTTMKQAEYWHLAAFFLKVRTVNANGAVKNGTALTVEETNAERRGKQNELPEAAKILPPKFLQGEQPTLTGSEALRPVLAKWLTSPSNPFFAKAAVNRTWAQFFGRGIVNPVDDMLPENAASHPELLQGLAEKFAAGGFDMKQLIRAICNSQAYQRSSKTLPSNQKDETLYSHMPVRVLSAEQLYDSLTAIIGADERRPNRDKNPGQKGMGNDPRDAFVNFFDVDDAATSTEYVAGIPQALRLMNSTKMRRPALVEKLGAKLSAEQTLEQIYLATLSRKPSAEESAKFAAYLTKGDRTQAIGDLVWAVLNSSEFTIIR
jgi:hypothetical protein